MTVVEFGPWTPDLPPLRPEGCVEARNCLPVEGGFRSFRAPARLGTEVLPALARGAFWLQNATGVYFNFAGSADNLYRFQNNGWGAVGPAAGTYSATSPWKFIRFGDRVVAVADNVAPQYYDLGSSTSFADLPNAPEEARAVAVVRDHIVMGGTTRSGTTIQSGPNVVEWSGLNNSEVWGPSVRDQSDTNELFGRGGRVQAITSGQTAFVLQEHSIYQMAYVGAPTVFRFDEIALGLGTPARDSVCSLGERSFFLGWDGFYSIAPGQGLRRIGFGRVDRWFRDTAASNADVVGAVDRRRGQVFWAFRTDSVEGRYDQLLCYDVGLDAWSVCDVDLSWISEFSLPGYTLDDLDAVLPGGIDATEFFMESDQYIGGAIQAVGFDSLGWAVTYTGAPVRARFETREWADPSNVRLVVQGARPLVDAAPGVQYQISEGVREQMGDRVAYGRARAPASLSGEAKIRNSARYVRLRVDIDGAFRHALGMQVRQNPHGGQR